MLRVEVGDVTLHALMRGSQAELLLLIVEVIRGIWKPNTWEAFKQV